MHQEPLATRPPHGRGAMVARFALLFGCFGLGVCVWPAAAFAATLPAQGFLRNASGGPASDGPYVFFLKLYDAKDAKAPLWQDAMPGVQVQAGLFQLVLGATESAPLKDDLLTSGKPLWLGVQVASDPELERVPLTAVARAYHAQVAAGLACTGCVDTAAIADNSVTAAKLAFTYAGSDAKGGPATSAKSAETAAFAKVAEAASKAASADEAASLSCTGCVTLQHLNPNVSKGFVSVKGGAITGDLAVAGAFGVTGDTTLTGKVGVNGSLDLGASTLLNGRLGSVDLAKQPCDGNLAGRLAYVGATGRLHVCDGKAWRKISFCAEACPPAGTTACGQPITDGCGDVGACTGIGTFCGTGTCTGGKCLTIAASCKALLAADPATKSGIYSLDPDGGGPVPAFQAYCDMTSDGGGWTLLLKQDGAKATLAYDEPIWTNAAVLAADKPDLDGNEFKSAGFATMPFKQVRIAMKVGAETKALTLPVGGSSLTDLFKGAYAGTSVGKDAWKSLFSGASTQPHCNREGVNADCGGRKVRLGIVTNQENDCSSCDSYLGIGHTGDGGCSTGASWCGMMASCSPDNGDKNVPAFGYLFVR